MGINNFFNFIRECFAAPPCKGCEARDFTIAILKEQLHYKDEFISRIENQQGNLIGHLTGQNRAAGVVPNQGQLHSIPRQSNIGSRIARAEASERDPVLAAQRKKEYEDRIESLMNAKPEIEVVEKKDASD